MTADERCFETIGSEECVIAKRVIFDVAVKSELKPGIPYTCFVRYSQVKKFSFVGFAELLYSTS
jgi:hypothetical protein